MGNHEGKCEHPISITMSMKQYLNSDKDILQFFGKLNDEKFRYDISCHLSYPVVHNLSSFYGQQDFLCPCMLLLAWVWVPRHPLHHPSWTVGPGGSLLQVYGWLSNLGASICAFDRELSLGDLLVSYELTSDWKSRVCTKDSRLFSDIGASIDGFYMAIQNPTELTSSTENTFI